MTTDHITEGNKLIAEFMGFVIKVADIGKPHPVGSGITKTDFIHKCEYYSFPENEIKNFSIPKYNDSWDWLMPVVDRISEIYNQADEGLFDVGLADQLIINLRLCGPNIQYVFDCVVLFIQWYNKNVHQRINPFRQSRGTNE